MQLGETIATYDVALALRGESGKFDVTSPTGEVYRVICKPDSSIASLEWSGDGADAHPFLIRKVAEPVAQESGKTANPAPAENTTLTRRGRAPFLIDNPDEDANSTSLGNSVTLTPAAMEENVGEPETVAFDFVFLESDPSTQLPCAYIGVRSEQPGRAAARKMLITASCANFNDLDAEIRRLHAQLEDLRHRAKKKFYQTHAMAAGA